MAKMAEEATFQKRTQKSQGLALAMGRWLSFQAVKS